MSNTVAHERRRHPADDCDRASRRGRSLRIRNHPAMVRRRGRGSLGVDGAAAVELAIAAPVLILLVLGVADYGVLMGDTASLESAARAGAEVAKGHPNFTTADLTSL